MQTFYFYDLETSGISPKESRIMQFAGQRTDLDLKPIGKPDNFFVKLNEDVLPDPRAIIVTGITPQKTIEEGYSEAEFLKLFYDQILQPGTIFTGFNTVRFDDEFMRYTLFRNFYDPYEWQWQNDCSRWDILDVARMTRALRPDGIQWPVDAEGKAINKLEALTTANKLDHQDAHDALSDVNATIAVARLIKTKQPKLFDYLLNIRGKKAAQQLVESSDVFVHTSGRLPAEFQKTTVVTKLFDSPGQHGASVVYDLRQDPAKLQNKSPQVLLEVLSNTKEHGLFVKSLRYNKCPAIAPLGVLNEDNLKSLHIDLDDINKNLKLLRTDDTLLQNIHKALATIQGNNEEKYKDDSATAEAKLYDGFMADQDKIKASVVRAASKDEVMDMPNEFSDPRLRDMFPRYKARNFPTTLTDEERQQWEQFRADYLLEGGQSSRLANFMKQMQEVIAESKPGEHDYLLQELQLYVESILPSQH